MRCFLTVLLLCSLISCNTKQSTKLDTKINENQLLEVYGRTEAFKDGSIALISPGSYISGSFLGSQCEVLLKGELEPYNYVSIELDGNYLGRIKIDSDTIKPYIVEVPKTNALHTIKIFKESEASNGVVLYAGLKVEEQVPFVATSTKYIEFIGNSITCGAASDGSVIPCDSGVYFDHQNVYFSYGSTVARKLNANFMLSSVSGIGIYRNWNDENIEEPIISQVYENLYLNTNDSIKYDFKEIPDIVSICLGTNDLSEGDGVKPRLPFNKEKYVANYIGFVKTVYSHYPTTQIVLLSSPMSGEDGNKLLVPCLKEVQDYFTNTTDKSILLFEFDSSYNGGCLWHPSVEDHQEMAEKLTSFFEALLN